MTISILLAVSLFSLGIIFGAVLTFLLYEARPQKAIEVPPAPLPLYKIIDRSDREVARIERMKKRGDSPEGSVKFDMQAGPR